MVTVGASIMLPPLHGTNSHAREMLKDNQAMPEQTNETLHDAQENLAGVATTDGGYTWPNSSAA